MCTFTGKNHLKEFRRVAGPAKKVYNPRYYASSKTDMKNSSCGAPAVESYLIVPKALSKNRIDAPPPKIIPKQ